MIKKYLLQIVVFTTGCIVMILEIVGSRVLAPYVGTSIFVWTSIIGVILASLSLGYYWGGKLADKRADILILAKIIFFAGVSIGLTGYLKGPLLTINQIIFPGSVENKYQIASKHHFQLT